MSEYVTKILIRRGNDLSRKTANTTGVIFDNGEPAWTLDTKRMYIGDGTTAGGIPIGCRNLGAVGQLYDVSVTGFTNEAIQIFTLSGAEVGDILYDRSTRVLYSLSSISNFPPLTSDIVRYDFNVLLNSNNLEFDTQNRVKIKTNGVGVYEINPSIAGPGLQKNEGSYLQIGTGPSGVTNTMMNYMLPNAVKVNNSNISQSPSDLQINPNSVLGRTSTGTLTSIYITSVLSYANFTGGNGVKVSSDGTFTNVTLSAESLEISETGIFVYKPLYTYAPVSFTQNVEAQAALTVNRGLTANFNSLALFNGDCVVNNRLLTRGAAGFKSTLSAVGAITCDSDIIAFATSDKRLKTNLRPVSNALDKVIFLTGYSFDWKTQDTSYNYLRGSDVGFMADEVEQVIPEAVSTRGDGIKAVNYNKVVPLLVQSIKELKYEIEALKER